MYWGKKEDDDNDETIAPWKRWRRVQTTNVETTAYVLLTYVQAGMENPYPIVKYLTKNQNGRGGFRSTQVNSVIYNLKYISVGVHLNL